MRHKQDLVLSWWTQREDGLRPLYEKAFFWANSMRRRVKFYFPTQTPLLKELNVCFVLPIKLLSSLLILNLLFCADMTLNEVNLATECINAIAGAMTEFTSTGAEPDFYVTFCTYNLSIYSMWAAAKLNCSPAHIEAGSEVYEGNCVWVRKRRARSIQRGRTGPYRYIYSIHASGELRGHPLEQDLEQSHLDFKVVLSYLEKDDGRQLFSKGSVAKS